MTHDEDAVVEPRAHRDWRSVVVSLPFPLSVGDATAALAVQLLCKGPPAS